MGRVYRAHDPVLDRPVALKTVSPALLAPGHARPVPARGPCRRTPLAPEHRHDLRGRRGGRHSLHRDGARGGHRAERGPPCPRPLPARAEGPDHGGRLPRARLRPPDGGRPPRRQAREHPRRPRRHGQDPRLRDRPARRVRHDAGRHRARHAELPLARAAAGRAGRPARGHVGGGRDPLRDAVGAAAVRGAHDHGARAPHRQRAAAPARRGGAPPASRPRRRGQPGAREGPVAALPGPRVDGGRPRRGHRRHAGGRGADRPGGAQARLRGELRGGAPAPRRGRPLGRARRGATRPGRRPGPHGDRGPHPGDRGAPAVGGDDPASAFPGALRGGPADPDGRRPAPALARRR